MRRCRYWGHGYLVFGAYYTYYNFWRFCWKWKPVFVLNIVLLGNRPDISSCEVSRCLLKLWEQESMNFSLLHRFWGNYFGTDEVPVEVTKFFGTFFIVLFIWAQRSAPKAASLWTVQVRLTVSQDRNRLLIGLDSTRPGPMKIEKSRGSGIHRTL